LADITAGRSLVAKSMETITYDPQASTDWHEPYQDFLKVSSS
jgi:hypothetical protein